MTPAVELAAVLHARALIVLEAYLDESYESQAGGRVFVVAGWIADSAALRTLEARWLQVLKACRPRRIREFKTADCLAGRGEFKGWSYRKRRALVARLVRALTDLQIIGGGAALLMLGPTPKHADYNTCVMYCLGVLTKHALAYPKGERVAYVLDERDKVKQEVEKTRLWMRRQRSGRYGRAIADRVGPLAFDISLEVPALQAADLLAHALYRHFLGGLTGDSPPAEFRELIAAKVPSIVVLKWDERRRELYLRTKGRWRRIVPRRRVDPERLGNGG